MKKRRRLWERPTVGNVEVGYAITEIALNVARVVTARAEILRTNTSGVAMSTTNISIDAENAEAIDECGKPCHPDSGCPACADYWQRMINEGFWDERRKLWTDAGFAEILRSVR